MLRILPPLLASFCFLSALSGPLPVSLAPTSHPQDDPASLETWPNRTSRANSDRWLVEKHDSIRQMRPRLLVINLANRASLDHLGRLLTDLRKALSESSRYHGYRNAQAPVFLDYQLFKFVDLRDGQTNSPTTAKVPYKPGVTNTFNIAYGEFFSEKFARHYGVHDPKNSHRFLRLDELVAEGYVHEVWLMGDHDPGLVAYECVELKPVYDENFARQEGKYVQSGNGGDPDQPWTGRSVRLGFINITRGIGCYLESLSHSFEGMANGKAIPYFTKYFLEFSGQDLKERYGLPIDSFYPLWGDQNFIEYRDARTAVIHQAGKTYTISNYVAFAGNVHFTPNGRRHYDLENTNGVMSTIEDWRIGSGPAGQDLAREWKIDAFAKYRDLANDCMGPWLIYWRQNVPGLDNKQKDSSGRPMKNWWPFLFY